jgi:hypothetical protein
MIRVIIRMRWLWIDSWESVFQIAVICWRKVFDIERSIGRCKVVDIGRNIGRCKVVA